MNAVVKESHHVSRRDLNLLVIFRLICEEMLNIFVVPKCKYDTIRHDAIYLTI